MTPGRAYRLASAVGDDPWVITPGVFSTELERVRALVDAVALDVSRQADLFSADQRQAWSDFVRRWGAFYNDHAGSPWSSSFTGGAYYQIAGFEAEALTWRRALVDAGGRPTLPIPERRQESPSLLSNVSPFMWGLLVVGGLFAVGYASQSLGLRVRTA